MDKKPLPERSDPIAEHEMTKPRLRVLQPKDGEIIDVIGRTISVAQVHRDGGTVLLKFAFENGSILYVPVPIPDDEGTVDVGQTQGAIAS